MNLTSRLTIALALAATVARADDDPDTEVARRLFTAGSDAYFKGAYEKALAAFEKARLAKPLPAFDFNIARCHDRLGHWPEALANYERFVATATDPGELAEAEQRIAELEKRVKSAGDRATAEDQYRSAVIDFNAGKYAVAAEDFQRSYQAVADPALLYHIAEAWRRAGDGKAAIRWYESYLREVPASAMRPAVEAHLATLRALAAGKPAPVSPPSATARPATPAAPIAPGVSDRLQPIADLIKSHREKFRACFDHWSGLHPGVGGKVKLTFYLDPDGVFDQAHAETVGFDAPEVGGCIVAFARSLAYPRSANEKFTRFTYPFDFKP